MLNLFQHPLLHILEHGYWNKFSMIDSYIYWVMQEVYYIAFKLVDSDLENCMFITVRYDEQQPFVNPAFLLAFSPTKNEMQL